jgi:hypothetical protein
VRRMGALSAVGGPRLLGLDRGLLHMDDWEYTDVSSTVGVNGLYPSEILEERSLNVQPGVARARGLLHMVDWEDTVVSTVKG